MMSMQAFGDDIGGFIGGGAAVGKAFHESCPRYALDDTP